MKYEKARNLFFDYTLMDEKRIELQTEINRIKRVIPYDNGPASMIFIDELDKLEKELSELNIKMKEKKEEIEILLRIFK